MDGLPIPLHPVSNGEYAPPPPTDLTREAARRTREAVDTNARRTGMSRRDFLRSACGTATALWVLAACSTEQAADEASTGRSSTSDAGGTFDVPDDATVDPDAADEVLGSRGEVIFDVQTHLLEGEAGASSFGSGFPQANCGIGDSWRDCFRTDTWIDLVLDGSDTSLALLSAIPVVADPDPLSMEVMASARRRAAELGCDGRVLMSGQVFPAIGDAEAVLDHMRQAAVTHPLSVWKCYTHAGGSPWRLDDADPDGARVGEVFTQGVRETGVGVVAVHKGLGDHRWASPADIGPWAAENPDLDVWVYHSGYESDRTERAFAGRDSGIDRLITSVESAGLGPGSNVYAELGSTWFRLMRSPTQAAHALGKLLAHLGPDNVLWGTDSIWYGSPQSQIEAFRAFQISDELQERHGYPALTDELKAKVLGRNAVASLGIDELAGRCDPSSGADAAAAARVTRPAGLTVGPTTATEAAATFARDHPWI